MAITKEKLQELNAETAAIFLTAGMPLSEAQLKALATAIRNGGFVFAGAGNTGPKGGLATVSASAIRALVRRHLLAEGISSDGGYMARLSESALERLTTLAR